MQVTSDQYCFVCGSENPYGLKARFQSDPLKAEAWCRLTLPAHTQGWQDIVHGGILAALLDEAAVYACRTRGEQFVTAEIYVRYKAPVKVGMEIEVRGQVQSQTRRVFQVSCSIEAQGTVLAEADAKIICLDGKKSQDGSENS